MKRLYTRIVKVGNVKIGGGNPVVIQSMAKTDTRDVASTVAEIRRLEKAGCEIVRVAVKDMEAARAIKAIKRQIKIPIVADIHFDYRLALESLASGADKIRINPGNMSDPIKLKEVIRAAKNQEIPIRIGLNSGSAKGLVKTALRYIRLFENARFRDIIVSVKSSGVEETVKAYRELAVLCNYPLHLGVTAAGPSNMGVVKSSIGIGALLLDGIGDTVRVSLTADPVEEVIAAKRILQALNLRSFGPNIISCPTCGRCQVNLGKIVKEFEEKKFISGHSTIAIMGCEVNGPGEAKEADIGIAFGKGSGVLFRKGKLIKKIKVKDSVSELKKLLKSDFRPPKADGSRTSEA